MKKQDPRAVTFDPPSRFPVKPQRGSIVNIASVSGLNAMGLAAYTPTKHAALGITRNGAKFYGPDGIRCNATCPSWTFTTMLEGSMGAEGHEGSKESEESSVCKLISLRRMAFAQEQANVVSFLLSDESSYINGAYIVVDGGYNDIR
jgi:NAD(P)-dependent dehydrogenase (short-subunit alcohol dehydrogenase family)